MHLEITKFFPEIKYEDNRLYPTRNRNISSRRKLIAIRLHVPVSNVWKSYWRTILCRIFSFRRMCPLIINRTNIQEYWWHTVSPWAWCGSEVQRDYCIPNKYKSTRWIVNRYTATNWIQGVAEFSSRGCSSWLC